MVSFLFLNTLTDTYVKVYLVKGKKCVEKHRTKTIKENLQPKYMEVLKFKSSPAGCLIQVHVYVIYACICFFNQLINMRSYSARRSNV